MSERKGFLRLDSFVRDVCAIMDDVDAKGYAKCVRITRSTLAELNMLLPYIKSELFAVSENMTIVLPEGVIDVLKVGYMNNYGRLIAIDKDDALRVELTNQGCESEPDEEAEGVRLQFHNFLGNEYGEVYGYRVKESGLGTWRFNRDTQRVEVGSGSHVFPGAELAIEYRTALDDSEALLIPAEAEPALRWKVLQMMNFSKNLGASQVALSNFAVAYRQLQDRYRRYSLEDLVRAIKGEMRLAPKY